MSTVSQYVPTERAVYVPTERAVEKPRFPRPPTHVAPPGQYIARGLRRRLCHFIKPPPIFSLRRNYEAVASFFQHLRHQIYCGERDRIRHRAIAFEELKEISPAAALVLAAELFRWQDFIGQRLQAIHQDMWEPSVAHILRSMGLFDFLRTPNLQLDQDTSAVQSDIEVIKYRSDDKVDGTKCADLLQHLTDISGPINAANFIYDGLIEALKNSRQHAYSEPNEWFGVPEGTWFMSGSYDKNRKRLTAAVYDLGVGIPRTLPRASIWEHLRPLLTLSSDDGQMIAAAMRYGRTRTDLPERGNGIPTMMRILDHHIGYLRIISGKGEAVYDSVEKDVKSYNHSVALGGTLIEWSISK